MTPAKARIPAAPRSAADESQNIRRMQRLAVILGLAATMAAGLVGYSAYDVTHEALVGESYDKLQDRATALASEFEKAGANTPDSKVLENVRVHFARMRLRHDLKGAYLRVLTSDGEIALDTDHPELEGSRAIDEHYRGMDRAKVELRGLRDILDRRRSWTGRLSVPGREVEYVAMSRVSARRLFVAIHEPGSHFENRNLARILPWAVGFGFTVLLAIPLALWGLSKAYTDSSRAEERARAAERRAADQVRMLREIDRAILEGGSVDEIARAALAQVRRLIPCTRASVALLHPEGQTFSLLAVEPSTGTSVGPRTLVPVADIGESVLAELRAGRVNVVEDTQVRTSMRSFFDTLRQEGVRSYLKVPLTAQGELIGTLNLGFDRVGVPTPEDVELAREVADVLALAVLQAKLYSELQSQKAELEKRVAERTRELSEVNEELEGYVHSVSHDLRAPLRAVRGFGSLLEEEVGEQLRPTEREYLHRMISASGRMDSLLRDLLAYSRLQREEVRVRPLDTRLVVQEAQDLLQVELDERGAILEIEEPLLPVIGHHSTLVQAISNLISNAAKFVEPSVPPRVRIRSESRGHVARLWVEDNGIGIAPEEQEKVFRVFERLNNASLYPGTGIGLAIVRRALERMGGDSGVESVPGQGSRFWIDLPGAEEFS